MRQNNKNIRYPYKVGRPSTGNGQLAPNSITPCRDIGHAWNLLQILKRDRPDERYVIRADDGRGGGRPLKPADFDALTDAALASLERCVEVA